MRLFLMMFHHILTFQRYHNPMRKESKQLLKRGPKPVPDLSDQQARELIFKQLRITNILPYEGKKAVEILVALRQNVGGLTRKELGEEESITDERVRQLETSLKKPHIKRFCSLLKPHLNKKVHEKWLLPGSFAVNMDRRIDISLSARTHREDRRISQEKMANDIGYQNDKL